MLFIRRVFDTDESVEFFNKKCVIVTRELKIQQFQDHRTKWKKIEQIRRNEKQIEVNRRKRMKMFFSFADGQIHREEEEKKCQKRQKCRGKLDV